MTGAHSSGTSAAGVAAELTASANRCHRQVEPHQCEHSKIDRAKLSIAPQAKLEDWSANATNRSGSRNCSSTGGLEEFSVGEGCVTIRFGERQTNVFRDNVDRIPGSMFVDDEHGDSLPHLPAVLTGLLDHWPAFNASNLPGKSWSLQDLATRTAGTRLSLDGGPSFARLSMCAGRVDLKEYQRYADNSSDGDSAPLYVFDPNILGPASTFSDDGTLVRDAFDTPACFSRDAATEVCDEKLRPLPPKWLLLGAVRSGTPIHDHPTTVAWNALLVGCKLWCCFPPDVDESALLLNLEDGEEDEEGGEFDLSAVEWFCRAGSGEEDGEGDEDRGREQWRRRTLDESAAIIVQRPGEVVFLPIGWFHVVLNVETSTAISASLTLGRDLSSVLPLFLEEEREFARWGQPEDATGGVAQPNKENNDVR